MCNFRLLKLIVVNFFTFESFQYFRSISFSDWQIKLSLHKNLHVNELAALPPVAPPTASGSTAGRAWTTWSRSAASSRDGILTVDCQLTDIIAKEQMAQIPEFLSWCQGLPQPPLSQYRNVWQEIWILNCFGLWRPKGPSKSKMPFLFPKLN